MQTLSIVSSIIAIISYYLITKKDIRGLYGWCFSNTVMLILAISRNDIGQIILWITYNVLNVYGIYNWKKDTEKND